METVASNKICISKEELLESFTQLYHAIKDYDELINLMSDDKSLKAHDIKSLVQSRINQLEFGSVNVKAMEIIGTYLRYTLDKFKGSKLTFLIPDNLNDDFFSLNDGYLDLSKNIERVEEELKDIEEKVYYLARLLPPFNVDKISLLLKAISSFFKSIVRKDIQDMESHINHMHHLTASKESYFVINDIGHMVRDIYNSLQDFSAHFQIEELEPNLVDEMPDAIDKLQLVIKRMEDSANSTLDDVESLLDRNAKKFQKNEELLKQCESLEQQMQEIKINDSDYKEKLESVIENQVTQMRKGLEDHAASLKEEEAILFDIISNQSFQDITGQTLKKIITFIEQLEFNLLQILQKYSGRFVANQPGVAELAKALSPLVGEEKEDGTILHGPQDNQEVANEVVKQDDVDKVLAQFGF